MGNQLWTIIVSHGSHNTVVRDLTSTGLQSLIATTICETETIQSFTCIRQSTIKPSTAIRDLMKRIDDN
jgi:hypothetical protein